MESERIIEPKPRGLIFFIFFSGWPILGLIFYFDSQIAPILRFSPVFFVLVLACVGLFVLPIVLGWLISQGYWQRAACVFLAPVLTILVLDQLHTHEMTPGRIFCGISNFAEGTVTGGAKFNPDEFVCEIKNTFLDNRKKSSEMDRAVSQVIGRYFVAGMPLKDAEGQLKQAGFHVVPHYGRTIATLMIESQPFFSTATDLQIDLVAKKADQFEHVFEVGVEIRHDSLKYPSFFE